MSNKIIALFILMMSYNSYAQQGSINITKDPRLEALVSKQSEITPPDVKHKIDGFRVQLYFDSSSDAINSARSKFMSQYPKMDTYIEYSAPNYFLKVGDFRTRLEAEKLKSEIVDDFPTSFVIGEKINLPRIDKRNSK